MENRRWRLTSRPRLGRLSVAVWLMALLFGSLAAAPAAQAQAQAQGEGEGGEDLDLVPGDGRPLVIARPTWDTGWFQAEVVAQLLAELGYVIDGPTTYDNASFYEAVQSGGVDLWANGWFPIHELFLPPGSSAGARPVGFEVPEGALQGYMIDLISIEEVGIETLADLADPAVAARFDGDGDGRADLIGCNLDWACHDIIEHHLQAFGLADTVEQVSADYGPLMDAAARRYASGDPLLYYNFTPNWTNGVLVPGRDVAWVPTPFTSLPGELAGLEDESSIDDVVGCLDDPCQMGFPPNDIRSVANSDLLDQEPAVAALLDVLVIPLIDIAEQNARMFRGEDAESDIELHAADWVTANRNLVDRWLQAAITAHVDAGGQLAPRPAVSDADAITVGTIRVATRPAPPFVIYDDGVYRGFTIDLLEAIAAQVEADLDHLRRGQQCQADR